MRHLEELSDHPLEEAEVGFEDGLVLLCSKCSGQQPGADGPCTMPSWDTWELRKWLKKRLTEEGLWPRVRVVTSSCLGVCSDGNITAVLGADAGGRGRSLVIDPERDAEELLALIRRSVAAEDGPASVG